MKNYRLTIQYNGKNYSGWQIQPNVDTIQQQIEKAIHTITREKVNLIGSGRTDAGVHALGQVANFRIPIELNIKKFHHSINSVLPSDIAVKETSEVSENFHSRFDAQKRSYLYIFSQSKSPFYKDFVYYYHPIGNMDIQKLNSIGNHFIGEHDFTSFAKKNSGTKDKICNINYLRWKKSKDFYFFRIDGNRFLHGMVRTIVGTILEIAEKDYPVNKVEEIIALKDREAAGSGVAARGLYLYKVKY